MSDVVERAKSVLAGVTGGPWTWDGDEFSDAAERKCPHGTQWTDHGPDLMSGDDEVITSSGYDASDLHVNTADAEFIAQARTLVPELVAEVERLRERLGTCLCDHDPESPLYGPSEECPQHGRPYAEWVLRGDDLAARIERVRDMASDPLHGPLYAHKVLAALEADR
ncbi:hypothetical protein AB0876_28895 [Mycobacterium sp. NPDC049093]